MRDGGGSCFIPRRGPASALPPLPRQVRAMLLLLLLLMLLLLLLLLLSHAVAPVVRTDVSPAGLNDTLGSVQFADTFGNKSALSEIRYMSDGSQSGGSSASSHGRSAASTALSEYERRLAVQQGQV